MTDALRETPAKLGLDLKSSRLSVTWHDGHASVYEGAYLRFLCPCAGCRGHAPGDVPPPTWEQVKDVRVIGGAAVGGYAIQLSFSDGHSTGIFAFDRLRDACPCALCGGGKH
jgi:DUF971 family protein